MHRVTAAVLLATLLLAAGCGGGDDDDATPAAKSTATAAAGKLDEDALLAVHDNLVTCAQQHDDLGLVAHLSGDQAISDTEGSGGGEYDDHLAAPKATVALTGAGAQFVGLRADTRHKTGASDVDVLIFPSEDEAATGREQLAQEAGGKAEQTGVFVNVTLRGAEGADADVLASCEDEASRR
jgi:hypothetical protein